MTRFERVLIGCCIASALVIVLFQILATLYLVGLL